MFKLLSTLFFRDNLAILFTIRVTGSLHEYMYQAGKRTLHQNERKFHIGRILFKGMRRRGEIPIYARHVSGGNSSQTSQGMCVMCTIITEIKHQHKC